MHYLLFYDVVENYSEFPNFTPGTPSDVYRYELAL